MHIQILVICIVRRRTKYAHFRSQREQKRSRFAHKLWTVPPIGRREGAVNIAIRVLDNNYARALVHDAAQQRGEAFAVYLRREQEAPFVTVRIGNSLVDEEHLRDVGEGRIVGYVVQSVAKRQQSGDVHLHGGSMIVILELGGRLGVALRGAIVDEMEEDVFEHLREGGIVAEPLFGIGSRDFLRALFDHLVGQTFGELLDALFDYAKTLGLPRCVFRAGLTKQTRLNCLIFSQQLFIFKLTSNRIARI